MNDRFSAGIFAFLLGSSDALFLFSNSAMPEVAKSTEVGCLKRVTQID